MNMGTLNQSRTENKVPSYQVMTQIAFIPIAAETDLSNICTSGIHPICPRLSQARGFQHHFDKSSCQLVPTPGPLPEEAILD